MIGRARAIDVVLGLGLVAPVLGAAPGCDSGSKPAADTKATPSPLQPRGIEEMKRVKRDVEKAQQDGLQRTDDAVDRAGQAEAVGRGGPPR